MNDEMKRWLAQDLAAKRAAGRLTEDEHRRLLRLYGITAPAPATRCSRCGASLDPNGTFCPECGAPSWG